MNFKKKFSHFKVAVLAAGAIMGAAPTVAALAPANVYAAESAVDNTAATGKTGFVKENNAWVYYKNGKASKATTITNGNVNGKHGWYYVKNGKVDLTYTGFAKNENGWWYVENGKVTFQRNDIINGNVNGKHGWWYIQGSKVTFTTTINKNKNGWWYIKNGMVDFGYTGFAKNSNGWWYIVNGKVDFNKNGVVSGTVNGKNSKWNVKGGKVVSEYSTSTTSSSSAAWKEGKASAYGGYTDPGCGSITANGSRVTESSMGVAIPLAWGRRDLLGHKVEIQYNGKTVTATINDLGGMGGGSRHLDLQPGVWRAFGFSSCNAWGVRTVKYRIL